MNRFHVVIPARYGSSRLPGKPLALINGVPMVVQTARSVSRANPASLLVATDDTRIADVVRAAGFSASLTRADHASGSDRVLEVVDQQGWPEDDIVINVQGDEPLMPPLVLEQLATALAESSVGVATLCERIERAADLFNPNIVKVVRDARRIALYFSRAPIPWAREAFAEVSRPADDLGGGQWSATGPADLDTVVRSAEPGYFRHVGVYGYRVSALRQFVSLPPAGLEGVEALEQLRLLEHGLSILVLDALVSVPGGVDTPADLDRLNRQMH